MLSNSDIINAISFHCDDCILCSDTDKAAILGQYLTQDFSVSSISKKMGISTQVIIDHLNAMLAMTSASIMVQRNLLKIAAKFDEIDPEKIKISDSINAMKVWLEFYKVTQRKTSTAKQPTSLGDVPSSMLMGMK